MVVSVMNFPDHLLTLQDWIALPEDNSRAYELVEGVLILSPRPRSKHQRANARLVQQLDAQLPTTVGALAETEVVIDPGPPATVRVPDVIVVPDAGIQEDLARWDPAEVLLAVEVLSQGTRRTDRGAKFAEYAEVGIEQYWLVDLDEPVSLTAYRLIDGQYEKMGESANRATLELAGARIELDLAALVTR
ncbi:Uma2 family endonuclease [Nocardia arthritidis]|uniref:Uma2 family endonuclease n=1 Tax=Nocardia arthritidis TaxID=228602 RepID=A0A6G9YQ03_9NOCA|nr:Uma2 family endonuclease [Nocardia arthritidis]QIS15379.1 Uma2 family endonuclease [Nocardia arthritidis]